MGIFSLFGKKDRQSASPATDNPSSRAKRNGPATVVDRTPNSQAPHRDAARATSMKIDAIESEMSSEFVNSAPPVKGATPGAGSKQREANATWENSTTKPETFQATLPVMGMSTGFLLGGDTWTGSVEVTDSESAQVIDEAAILFANDQIEIVEQLLQDAIREDQIGPATAYGWWMLLDLYQITGQQDAFENLSVEYASKFETSPPAWNAALPIEAKPAATGAAVTPAVAFSGKLDSGIVKQLERIQKLSENHRAIKLDFVRVNGVDSIGCGLLLRVFKRLKKSGLELVLAGAPELADKICSILQVGRRDETEAPWLLLLEILQLLNREKEFEETSIDYCITFEVSPPAFVAPQTKVTMAAADSEPDDPLSEYFLMPAVVEDRVDDLIRDITGHAAIHTPALIDCSRLTRVEFGAAGQLLNGLAPLSGSGKNIEFHNVNHLVAALFNVMGMKDIARVVTRKN